MTLAKWFNLPEPPWLHLQMGLMKGSCLREVMIPTQNKNSNKN